MLRRSQLCPQPRYCPDVITRNPADYQRPDAPPCDECPLALLELYLASPSGRLVGHVIDLDFALQAGITVSLKDISYPEFLLLRYLAEERNRFQQEEIRKVSEKHGR